MGLFMAWKLQTEYNIYIITKQNSVSKWLFFIFNICLSYCKMSNLLNLFGKKAYIATKSLFYINVPCCDLSALGRDIV